MRTIYLIGDSTVDTNSLPFMGWGGALQPLTAEDVIVKNHALSGRSSKSFWNEGHFQPVQESMKAGDLLMIQFGHNDEKDDAERHTDPETTMKAYLNRYIDAALSRGVQPVLLTPVCRRYFTGDHSLMYTHGEYARAIRELAKERQIPLIDLKLLSRAKYLELGEEKTAALFVRLAPGEHPDFPDGHDDKTHFNAYGAAVIAKLVTGAMREMDSTAPWVK